MNKDQFNSDFEHFMALAAESDSDPNWRRAVLRITDTAFVAKLWFQEHCPDQYGASDVIALAEMIENEMAG